MIDAGFHLEADYTSFLIGTQLYGLVLEFGNGGQPTGL